MKKIIGLFVLVLLLAGCGKLEIHNYSDDDLDKFNKILTNVGNGKTKSYDLRSIEECEAGRIPGFLCMRTVNSDKEVRSLDKIYEDLLLITGGKKGYLIILMDSDGRDSLYLAELLLLEGYNNVHYFESGYSRYEELMGQTFTPETGECDC